MNQGSVFKQFFKDSGVYGISTLFSKALAVLLIPFYTRMLAPEDFGVVDLLFVVTNLVNLTIALEVSQGFAIYFSENKDERSKKVYATTTLWFTLAVYATFVTLAAAGLSLWGGALLEGKFTTRLVMVYLAALFLQGLQHVAHDLLRWNLLPTEHALVSIVQASVTAAVGILLVVVLDFGVIGVIYAQLAAAASAGGFALWRGRGYFGTGFSSAALRRMLGFSIPLVPSSLAVFVSLYVDRLLIGKLLGLQELGLYGIGFRFAAVASLVMSGFQGAMTPLVYSRHHEQGTASEIARIFKYFLVLAGGAVLALALFAREISVALTTPAYHSAYRLIPVLACASLLSSMYIFAPGTAIYKKTKLIATISLATAVTNLMLNLVMIPSLGTMGAALATLIASGLAFVLYMVTSQRYYSVPHHWGSILGAAAITATVAIATLRYSSEALSPLGLLLKAQVLLAGVVLLALVLIGPREVARLFRR